MTRRGDIKLMHGLHRSTEPIAWTEAAGWAWTVRDNGVHRVSNQVRDTFGKQWKRDNGQEGRGSGQHTWLGGTGALLRAFRQRPEHTMGEGADQQNKRIPRPPSSPRRPPPKKKSRQRIACTATRKATEPKLTSPGRSMGGVYSTVTDLARLRGWSTWQGCTPTRGGGGRPSRTAPGICMSMLPRPAARAQAQAQVGGAVHCSRARPPDGRTATAAEQRSTDPAGSR